MKFYLFAISILIMTFLTQGCSESKHHEGKTPTDSSLTSSHSSSTEASSSQGSSSSENNITVDPTIKSVELSIPVKELHEHNETISSVIVTYVDKTNSTPKTNIVWHISNTNTIEVNGTRLLAKNEGNTTIQAEVGGVLSSAKSIVVYKTMHGHRLPPEPDPVVNNATLLGIDSNGNGVRDDVERWIYTRYDKHIPCEMVQEGNLTMPDGTTIPAYKKICADKEVPYHQIVREVAMQGARATQIIIQEPENAKETREVFAKAYRCNFYFSTRATELDEPLLIDQYIFDDEFKAIQFNTINRARAFAKYNHKLSGGIYPSIPTEEMRAGCDFDVDELLEK